MIRVQYLAGLPSTVLLVLLAACGSSSSSPDAAVPDGGPVGIDATVPEPIGQNCNALGGSACVLPWPSAIYETADKGSPTGVRLAIPDDVLPVNGDGKRVGAALYNTMDGWSANIPLLMAWPSGFDPAPLADSAHPEKSLDASSPTVMIDLETGERVPHFAEPDLEAKDLEYAPPGQVALIIRPIVRLTPGKRYAVGIRNTLKSPTGGPLAVATAFRALVDGTPTEDARIERVRPDYEAIFAKLAAAGLAKSDLVVAWAFTVRTDEPVHQDSLDGRDAMLAAIGDGAGWKLDLQGDSEGADPTRTLRVVNGTFEVPNLLTGTGGADSLLYRDEGGHVAVNPEHPRISAPFSVTIPRCAETATLPLPIVVFGHGLIGDIEEAQEGYVPYFANRECFVIVATNWRGMSTPDLNQVGLALNDVDQADTVMQKLVQGVNQFVALETLARKQWAGSEDFLVGGKAVMDPTKVYFYGISQGSIFGGTFMAIDPFIEYGVMGVPANNFSMIIERSTNWNIYRMFIYRSYTDNWIHPQILLTLAQTRWDLTDGISYVAHLTGDVLPRFPMPNGQKGSVPRKHVLMQMAYGDSSVNNLGAELWARTAGFKILGPTIYDPYGLESDAGPLDSALTQWDEHRLPRPPGGNVTPEENHTHGSLRVRDKINDQIKLFFASGQVSPVCKMGDTVVACDCTSDEVCGPPHF